MKNIKPFVKWAGGKRQLLPTIKENLPENFNNYFEPFLGGGAVLLELQPEHAAVGDVNEILIATYKAIRDCKQALTNWLDVFEEEFNNANRDDALETDADYKKYECTKKEFYYLKRKRYNELISKNDLSLETCALFIFLNKTCFNGLYRVNSNGEFNVPFNNKKELVLYEKDNLDNLKKYLQTVDIEVRDFEETCKNAKAGDFVFFDSPYAPLNDTSFEAYTKEGFSLENHQRLARLFKELSDKGVYCMLTNHNTELINELYKDYKIRVVDVRRSINRNKDNRKGQEVIITNY